ncbi:MAG: tRNA (adenosine(37)-N6)-dimethylallyltransferase MiaA [Verrucomicrobiota bacterium]
MGRFATTVPAILGPTCSGKTDVAVELARRCGGEIISCDSMQVYRELNAGTAKPSPEQRAAVPHHLVDILSMRERWDAGRFRDSAESAIRDIAARGRFPVLAGGTGLYAKALIHHLPLLPSDATIFQAVIAQSRTPRGLQDLAAEAAERDPEAAENLRANSRRLMRAVEVLRITGKLPGELQTPASSETPDPAFFQVVLMPDPDVHKKWIRERTETMLNSGWLEEVRALVAQGLFDTPTAHQALGYRQIARFLELHPDGGSPDDQALLVDEITKRTWQFARRQRTWFRHQHPGAIPIPICAASTPEEIAAKALESEFLIARKI